MGTIQSIDGYFPVPVEPLMFPDRRRRSTRQTTTGARSTRSALLTRNASRMHLVEPTDRPANVSAGIRLLPARAVLPGLRRLRADHRARLLDGAYLGTALALAAALWWTLL